MAEFVFSRDMQDCVKRTTKSKETAFYKKLSEYKQNPIEFAKPKKRRFRR
jgi:hypothetical protein